MENNPEFIQWLATLGVGGVIAVIVLTFYRKDIKQYTELWKEATNQLMSIVKENTASNVKLISLIEAQERNLMRKSDIADLLHRSFESGVAAESGRRGENET